MFDKLRDKLGPFPVWVWGLIIGIIIVAYAWYANLRNASTTDDDDAGISKDNPESAVGYGSGIVGSVSDLNNPGDKADLTQHQWLMQAVAAAVNSGTSTLTAQVALQKYLYGAELSSTEAAIVNHAISIVGLPPDDVDIPTVATPTPTPTPTPDDDKTVTDKIKEAVAKQKATDDKAVQKAITDTVKESAAAAAAKVKAQNVARAQAAFDQATAAWESAKAEKAAANAAYKDANKKHNKGKTGSMNETKLKQARIRLDKATSAVITTASKRAAAKAALAAAKK